MSLCQILVSLWTTKYSQTCEQGPPKGEAEHYFYRQVVFIWSFVFIKSTNDFRKVVFTNKSGLNSEVVLALTVNKQPRQYDTSFTKWHCINY